MKEREKSSLNCAQAAGNAENDAATGNEMVKKVQAIAAAENAEVLTLAVSIEADINELETFEERQLFGRLGA